MLGLSIEERPEEVALREVFGHWEIDTLISARAKDNPVLLTLVERKTRSKITINIDEQNQPKIDQAMNQLYEQLGITLKHSLNQLPLITNPNLRGSMS